MKLRATVTVEHEPNRLSDERDSTQVTLMFVRKQGGDTYIAVDSALATLRAMLPLNAASVIEDIELEWRRAAEKALST